MLIKKIAVSIYYDQKVSYNNKISTYVGRACITSIYYICKILWFLDNKCRATSYDDMIERMWPWVWSHSKFSTIFFHTQANDIITYVLLQWIISLRRIEIQSWHQLNNFLRRPGIEPGSTAWKAAMLTTIPPTLDK